MTAALALRGKLRYRADENKRQGSEMSTGVLRALRSREQGIESAGNSPEEFAQLMHADIEKWIRVTREAGIKPQ
jgi:hypothetical protein